MKYKNLFSKGRIGNLELKNRIVMPAMGTSLASSTGEATQELIRYYEERAKGGCGLIITEITRVDNETGVGTPNQLSAITLNHIPQLERLARTVHKHDTKIFVQLHHPGRESHGRVINGRQIVAPSPIPCKVCKEMPRELSTSEVEELVKKFVTGAKIAQTAGIDGVELHGAHGYLIGQFISPYTNKRTDKYGGSFMNRMRFITEIIMGIRHICGPNFPISARISGDEFVEGGLSLEQAVKAALYLESIGINAINVSSGLYESGYTIIEPIAFEQGWKRHLAQAIKDAVKIPVIATDVIRKPDFAESLIADGNVDFVALGRAQLADPEWGVKAMEGRDEDIRPCISCLHCIEELEACKTIKCAVNARMGRELEFDGIEKNGDGRTAVVVGAGPSGMEAARVLALKGFKVVLFEKEKELGGMLALGNKPPKKDKLTWLIEYYETQFRKLGVEVRLNTEATIDMIKELNPYTIFVGAGSNPIVPPVEGINNENVYNVSDILSGKVKVENEKVVVIGAGMTGLETAEYLAVRNNKVSIADMLPTVGTGIYPANLATVMKNFGTHGVQLLMAHRLVKIGEGFIELVNTNTNQSVKIEADKVVLSLGIRSNRALVASLEEHFDRVRIVGDADKPGRIAEAVRAGFEKAYVLE